MSMEKVVNEQVTHLSGLLLEQGKTVSVAESCTGGWLSKVLTDKAGSSAWFAGGVVSYSNDAKHNLLSVKQGLLDEFGAVSQPVSGAMAVGAQRAFSSSVSVSITGIAGPDGGSVEKPVGLVWFGLQVSGQPTCTEYKNFKGSRDEIRLQAVHKALALLIESLSD